MHPVMIYMALSVAVLLTAAVAQAGVTITKSARIPVRDYSTFPSLIKCPDGSVLCYDLRSTDEGQTWQRAGDFGFPLSDATRPYRGANTTLGDGTILLIGRYTRKHEWEKDVYVTELYRSSDNFASYGGPARANMHVPNIAPGTDEYEQPVHGPFFEHSIVEMPGGELLATMWGWFRQDQTPVDYPDRWHNWKLKKSRVFLVKSKDKGLNWHYVSTIACDPNVGPEGFRTPSLVLLRNGELLCLMCNGDGGKPLWLSRSQDGGNTWGSLEKVDVSAGYGDLLVLSDGALLLTYGRPGLYVVASADSGRTWSKAPETLYWMTRSSAAYTGHAALAEVKPGTVLCVYNDMTSLHARIFTVTRNKNEAMR